MKAMSAAKTKSPLRAALPFLLGCIACVLMAWWGFHSGSVAVPVRGPSLDVARVRHPFWFWFVESLWTAFAGLIGFVGMLEFLKPKATSLPTASPELQPKPSPTVSQSRPPSDHPPGSELKSTSPSGRYIIRVYPQEMRMSHWVDTPELIDTATHSTLFAPRDSSWSMDSATWQSESVVSMTLRRYPGDHSSIKATFNCAAGTADIGGVAIKSLSDIARIERALRQAYETSKSTYRPIRS